MTGMEPLFEEAKRYIPGGVNSPVRAFGSVGGTPVFFASGHGAILRDASGHEYIDYVGSWGPLIVGHSHPRVVTALRDQDRALSLSHFPTMPRAPKVRESLRTFSRKMEGLGDLSDQEYQGAL